MKSLSLDSNFLLWAIGLPTMCVSAIHPREIAMDCSPVEAHPENDQGKGGGGSTGGGGAP